MFETESSNPQPFSYEFHLAARRARSLAIAALLRSGVRKCAEWLGNLGRVSAWLAHMAAEAELRRHVRALQRLDDRMLQDIGFSRGEIEYAVRNGRSARSIRIARLRQRGRGQLPPAQAVRQAAQRQNSPARVT